MGLGSGMALGTAAIVRVSHGVTMAPEIPVRIVAELARYPDAERPDVVLVAQDYRVALAWVKTLQWGRVVAIVTSASEPYAPVAPVPSVVNVGGLMQSVQNDMLLLVDAEHGVVLADPDGVAIAQYQLEHDHVDPRRRVYIEDVHLPARTLDGRTVQIMAKVRTADQVDEALKEGADGLYVPFDAPLLPVDADEPTLRRNLFALLEQSAGKPLILSDQYTLPLVTILEASMRANITLAVPPREDLEGLGLREQVEEFQAAEAECIENNVECSPPRLAANVVSTDGYCERGAEGAWVDSLVSCGATRLVLSMEDSGVLDEAWLPTLAALVSAATRNLVPSVVSADNRCFNLFGMNELRNELETALRLLIGIGADGVIVVPAEVSAAKKVVGDLTQWECRQEVRRLLDASGYAEDSTGSAPSFF